VIKETRISQSKKYERKEKKFPAITNSRIPNPLNNVS
jgi:hypothetical protein